MTMRVLIVDDELLARRAVRHFLGRYDDVEIVAENGDGISAVESIRTLNPDVVFLDIQMPEMSGMEVIASVGEKQMPPTILLSAHEQYAIRAFEFQVADYVLKPFGRERFDKAFHRALEIHTVRKTITAENPAPSSAVPSTFQYLERLSIPVRNGRIVLIDTKHVEWIEAAGNLLRVHARGVQYEFRETLHAIEKKLDPKTFVRIHRSTLVNTRFVQEIRPWVNGQHIVTMRNGNSLRMSRYQRGSLLQLKGHAF